MNQEEDVNLFLVTSPFQLICAMEAIREYKLERNILAITKQVHSKGQQQIKALLNEDEWDKILELPIKNKTFKIPAFIRKIRKETKNKEINNILHGEYAAWRTKTIIKNIKYKHEIMFDDGTATINDYNQYLKNKKSTDNRKGFKDLLLIMQGISPPRKMSFRENFDLFSIYQFDNFPYAKKLNKLSYIKSKLNSTDCYSIDAPAGFLGQGEVSFDGNSGMTLASYFKLLKKYHQYTKKEIIYFPHRSESKAVRSEVEKLPFITFHDSEWPIEIEISKKKIKLSSIAGVSSTALYTLSLIHNDMPIYSMHQDDCSYYKNTDRLLKAYEELEEYYSKSNIKYI